MYTTCSLSAAPLSLTTLLSTTHAPLEMCAWQSTSPSNRLSIVTFLQRTSVDHRKARNTVLAAAPERAYHNYCRNTDCSHINLNFVHDLMHARAVFQIPLPYYIYGRLWNAKAQTSHRRSRRATPKVEGEGRRWGIGAVSEAADALLFAGADEEAKKAR